MRPWMIGTLERRWLWSRTASGSDSWLGILHVLEPAVRLDSTPWI